MTYDLSKLRVGDEVMVYDANGWTWRAEITALDPEEGTLQYVLSGDDTVHDGNEDSVASFVAHEFV